MASGTVKDHKQTTQTIIDKRSNPKKSLHPLMVTDNPEVLETNISEPLQALLVVLATAPLQSPIQDLSTSKDR